ncbi:DoxX family membrane protein [Actinacidiphila acidipaludis]
MPRVPSDPAQVVVNHASFRVRLGGTSTRALGLDDTAKIPVVPQSAGRRRAPVVWSGQSAPGDALAGELLQAVRRADSGAATQVLPRVDETTVLPPVVPTVVGQRSRGDDAPTGLLPRPHGPADDERYDDERYADQYGGTYDEQYGERHSGRHAGPPRPRAGDREPVVGYRGIGRDDDRQYGDDADRYGPDGGDFDADPYERRPRNRRGEPVKHAWYPGRRMNLGIVLLPLRVFLGFISIYAGMGKLCDRVYFDGGQRGSMVTWLRSLHPWALAEPLRDTALNHPVGAGLSIAFLQVVVGVLTVFGLWQRVAATIGAALSVALLVTVSWRTVPVYDAPDFIYLAAWSPLIIAGAPVYSVDGRLASDAWRKLGPRVDLWDLRRRVLRRGAVLATVVIGLTLLIGSVLGAAVRASSTHTGRPAPAVTPTNNLPGSPLPEVTGGDSAGSGTSPVPPTSAPAHRKAHASPAAQTPSPTATHRPSSRSTGTSGYSHSTSTPSGSGTSGGSGSQAPTHSAPTQAPPPPSPAPKPTQGGAIGGLLGSHSPTGLLLGLSPGGAAGGSSGAPQGNA